MTFNRNNDKNPAKSLSTSSSVSSSSSSPSQQQRQQQQRFSSQSPPLLPPTTRRRYQGTKKLQQQDAESDGNKNDGTRRRDYNSGTHNNFWENNNSNNNDDNETKTFSSSVFSRLLCASALKSMLGFTLALYVLNQKALLPKPVSAIVSKVLFWPTMPITVGRRIGRWKTVIDDVVVMGGAPFGFIGIPESLYEQYGVRGVINMCDEYEGPTKSYDQLGIQQLRLPTVDHFIPDTTSLEKAVQFIQKYKDNDLGRVYVHCRAGHGRSAAAVFAWLLSKEDDTGSNDNNVNYVNNDYFLKQLNEQFCQLRYVKSTLWRQPSIVEYYSRLLNKRRKGPGGGGGGGSSSSSSNRSIDPT